MKMDLKLAQDELLKLFEQTLFVLADPLDMSTPLSANGSYLKTAMSFSGDLEGEFVMLFPEDNCKEIMSNYLGIESDDPQILEMSNHDAANEIMNILGAHILSGWLSEKGRFSIGLPLTENTEAVEDELKGPDKITGILIDGRPVFLKTSCR